MRTLTYILLLVGTSCLAEFRSATLSINTLFIGQQPTLTNDLTFTLPASQSNAASVFYNDGRLYVGSHTHPAWLTTMPGSDLSDTNVIWFPIQQDPATTEYKYVWVTKMQWLGTNLIVQFAGSSQDTIVAVETNGWTWADIISTNRINDTRSFCILSNTVYVAGLGQADTLDKSQVASFTPPSQNVTEWFITNGGYQYGAITASGDSVYWFGGDGNSNYNYQVVKLPVADPNNRVSVTTSNYPNTGFSPEVTEYGGYFYTGYFQSFYGSDDGVPADILVRVNKTTLLAETLPVTGRPRGASRSTWKDSKYLWIARPNTISFYDGNIFRHFDVGTDDPGLIIGDGLGHLFTVESHTNPVVVRRYLIQ